ncbi:MAG: type I-U CRISPR-associated helicase/endonuclease Cas3 [Polyangiaceae bacterium]|nr:type I-U CRISPR-associated helicase/endonuclease Cas3 [Polyangiaceae bacterium]
MNELSLDHFDAFFSELHGPEAEPFPWQRRLVRKVAAEGRWPELLDLPTGTGKTTALDIAVFAQALEAERPPHERKAPRRIVLVVDRRTVVDQAHERAMKLAKALHRTSPKETPVLAEVSRRLRRLAAEGSEQLGDSSPLGVHLLRGGMPRDNDWARSPTRPLIAVSTVDQVGSRLLFRGYGLSEQMAAVHAGLLANDVLFLLDEVHLARPFRDLLCQLKQRYRAFSHAGLPDRWQVVQMSATADTTVSEPFGLDPDDTSHPRLRLRLEAHKLTVLQTVKVSGSEEKRKRTLAAAIVHEAEAQLAPGRAIGIVVNRVQAAQFIFEALKKPVEASNGTVRLATGRMRPLDRQELEHELKVEFGSDRDRAQTSPRVVVATQCIEAGADLDFDRLLTECASLDALRQRFGRLDRLGTASDARAVVFAREDQISDKAEDDPVYGKALAATWNYLNTLEQVDFGLEHFPVPDKDELGKLVASPPAAPLLLPAHLDAWVQTTPPPLADPDPALWLHGPQPVDPEVTLVWRADLTEFALRDLLRTSSAAAGPVPAEWLDQRLDACPPRSMEALSVPLAVCRAWLRRQTPGDITDAGALAADEEARSDKANHDRPAVVWRRDGRGATWPRSLRPGDVVVVPSSYGGLREGTWAPDSDDPVIDLGDAAQLWQRRRAQLRLHSNVLAGALKNPSVLPVLPTLELPEDSEGDPLDTACDYLEQLEQHDPVPWAKALTRLLSAASPRQLRLVELAGPAAASEAPSRVDGQKYWALVLRRPISRETLRGLRAELQGSNRHHTESGIELDASVVEATSDDDHATLTGVEVTLKAHTDDVVRFTRSYAAAAGLAENLQRALELAASWHDLGKADGRFQRWLLQGSAFKAAVAKELLAKSAMPAQDRAARQRARERSGYPERARHELMSLALIQQSDALRARADDDWDLVLYLVSSHHGWCRPFAPFAEDPHPTDVAVSVEGLSFAANSAHGLERLDSGVAARFWRLVRRYGWYGLAWLEALFRLSDHRASESETEQPEQGAREQNDAA